MVTIEILQEKNTAEDEPTIKEKVEIEEIQLSRIAPVDIQDGIPIPMNQLSKFINKISPLEELQSEEPESYFAQQISVYHDGNLSLKELDIPHYIGLRVVLENVLQKYGTSETLKIKIS